MVRSIIKVTILAITSIFINVEVSSGSSLKCEVVEQTGMFNPEFPNTIYRMTVRAATESNPQSFQFDGPSSLGFGVTRAVSQSPGYVRIEVEAKDIVSGETEHCFLDRVDLKLVPGFYKSSFLGPPAKPTRDPSTIALVKFSTADTTQKRWSIRLYDPSNGGILEDGPYALDVEINGGGNSYEKYLVNAKPPGLPWRSLDPKDSGSFSLQKCQLVPGPIRPGLALKLTERISLNDIPEDNSSLVFNVASGRRLYARAVGGDPASRPSIRFYSDSFFNPICSLTALSDTVYGVAQQPWENLSPTWRVEIKGGTAPTGYVELFREDAPEIDSSWFIVDRLQTLDCVDRKVVDGRRFKPKPPAPNDFQGATSLSLRIHDDTNTLSSNSLPLIHQAILDATALWRRMCTRCAANQLAILSIDGEVFQLDTVDSEWPLSPMATQALGSIRAMSSGMNQRIGTRTPIQRYKPVSLSDEQRAVRCDPDENHTRHFINFSKTPVCRKTQVTTKDELKLDLVFVNGSTSCGDAVACWNNNGVIQFDTQHFRYYLNHPSNVIVGKGPIAVDLLRVFTHEAGHWIGLDHIAGPFGIMSEFYDETRCIDDAAITRLNAIVTGEEKAPFRPTGDALKYRRPSL